MGHRVFYGAWLWVAGGLVLPAEPTHPRTEPESAAYVRLWNFNPPEGQSLMLSEDQSTAPPLLETPANWVSAGYVPVAPGSHRLRLESAPEDEEPLLRCVLRVAGGNFVTLLVVWPGGTPEVRLLDETPPDAPLTSGVLTVRHFIPGAAIWIQGPGFPQPRAIHHPNHQTFPDLVRGLIPLRLKAGIPGLARSEWTLQADFSHCASQTLLLVLDPYGRFRPRLVPSGQCEIQPEEPEDPAGERAQKLPENLAPK
jgi:hypothetical protein